MLPPTIKEPVSVLKVLSARKALGDDTSNSSRMEQEDSLNSKTNTNNHQHEFGYTSRRSKFKSHFAKQNSDRSFPSLNTSGSGGSCGPGLLTNNIPTIPTRNIVNRALEVMSKSLKDTDYIPRQPVKSIDDGDTEDESEKDQTSDNDNDVPAEPTSRLGNITAQLSFRKIAKKRRKAGGRISFHHTKSSKEYLRKAQQAYQRLKIREQEQQNDQNCQPELESGRDSIEKVKNPCKHHDRDPSSRTFVKTRDSEVIDYGYGDPADTQPQQTVDYGYGDPTGSQPQQTVDYGYGDPAGSQPQQTVDYGYGDPAGSQPQQTADYGYDDLAGSQPQQTADYGYCDPAGDQPQHSRRGGRARRRNSVTKFSIEAANVVAAQAAAERILQLKPSLTSLVRSCSTTPTGRRQLQNQPQRSNTKHNRDLPTRRTGRIAAMQTTLHRQHQERQENHQDQKNNPIDKKVVDRLEPPQRSSRHSRGVCRDRGSVIKCSPRLQEQEESKQSKHDNSSSSDYFSSDPKPKNLLRRNSGRLNSTTFRFNTPARTSSTSSWLSHDNSFSTVNNDDDDDDADSLASDMESLCSIRDGNYRLDTHYSTHTLKNTDIPPMLPTPPPNRRTRFTGSRSNSGETNLRRSLVVSWSNGSNKEGSLSRFAADKSRTRRERQIDSNKLPILPFVGIVTTNGSASKSCMPAPLNRTPSYKGPQQRQD